MCLSRYTFPLLFSDFIIPFFLKHYVVPTKKQLCFCILDTSKDSNSFIFTSQRFNLLLIFDILRWHSEFEMICFPSASVEDKLNNRERVLRLEKDFPKPPNSESGLSDPKTTLFSRKESSGDSFSCLTGSSQEDALYREGGFYSFVAN